MTEPEGPSPPDHAGGEAVLRAIVEGTVSHTGEEFFAALVRHLCDALGTSGAWVTEYLAGSRRLRALAFWLDGQHVPDYEYRWRGRPASRSSTGGGSCTFPTASSSSIHRIPT